MSISAPTITACIQGLSIRACRTSNVLKMSAIPLTPTRHTDLAVPGLDQIRSSIRTADAYVDYLVARGHLDRLVADRALEAHRQTREHISVVLSQLGLLSDEQSMSTLVDYFQVPALAPDQWPDHPVLDGIIPSGFVRDNRVLPIKLSADQLTVAISDPFAWDRVEALGYFADRTIVAHLVPRRDLEIAIARLYPERSQEDADTATLSSAPSVNDDDIQRLKDMASEAPIVRLVSQILTNAVTRRASDVHIEPMASSVRVRYRIDGIMVEVERLPGDLLAGVATRIKILGKLNIAERRLPQDGRTKFVVAGRDIDIRVSTTPTLHGESIVLRILDRSQVRLTLASLGFNEQLLETLAAIVAKPNGILLVTGPTGSGKSTTLYAALSMLNSVERKIFSLEDPVEQMLPGINQIPVKPEIGLDFVHCLRSILRQDPDVIMIGEMRDVETAATAVRASLTGHLVLSTLHTNSAAASITRLLDMGVEDYLLASSLQGVLAQRLVRRLCGVCSEPDPDGAALSERLIAALPPADQPRPCNPRRAVGCAHCGGTGFSGRTTMGELLVVDERLRPLIRRGVSDRELENKAKDHGMETLHQAGLRKVLEGETTLSEVLRVTAG